VGPNILKFIAPVIAKAIKARTDSKPLSVIACENMIGATDTLAEFIKGHLEGADLDNLSKKARFANSAIDRIVPAQDPNAGLDVKIEEFFEWVVDETRWEPEYKHPDIKAVHWVRDLDPYIERKLYTVNTSHAAAAYYGHNRGKKFVDEAMADKEIHDIVRNAVRETAHLIVNKHGISEQEQKDYVEKIIARISNPGLKDGVDRVGRAPLRKLGKKERFVGPASQLAERGETVDALLGCIEVAFRFQNVPGDEESVELSKILKENDAEAVVEKVCGLTKSEKLYPHVVKIVKKVQGG
jgi:mannitol-1-phosphate 5-dehydrogenase